MSIRQPKYFIDENFFDVIDTEAKAYFLGLLYADGSVSKKDNQIKISLKEEDREILEKLNTVIKNEKKLTFYKKTKESYSNNYCLIIYSKKIKEQLVNKGCIPLKTFILKWPQDIVPQNLLNHFLRGYFDGDGCFTYRIYKEKYLKPSFNIVSTLNMCNEISELFKKELKCNCCIRQRHKNNKTTRQLEVSGSKQITKILTWLYKDANFFIQRKLNKFNLFLSEYDNFKKRNPNHYKKIKLSTSDIKKIQHSQQSVETLANKFNVSKSKIYNIKKQCQN